MIVIGLLFALSLLVGRWEHPREIGPTPPAWAVVVAAVLTIVPGVLIIQFFLDLGLAILGAVFYGVAILIAGRWPSASARREPVTESVGA